MAAITGQKDYRLRIDFEDFNGETRFAEYIFFRIDDASNKYLIRLGGYFKDAGM